MGQKMPAEVGAVFATFPGPVRELLADVRETILKLAAETPGVGRITETLKWGQPAYLTAETGSGSTVRLGQIKGEPGHAAVFFICHTHLVDRFREMMPDAFRYEGDRAILLPIGSPVPEALGLCLGMALTYHRRT
jgi:hypothetical protein